MTNPAYPNGQCSTCGWGLTEAGECDNDTCQDYGNTMGEPSADYLRKEAIDEIMWVATFETVEDQRAALEAAYSAGYHDAEEEV